MAIRTGRVRVTTGGSGGGAPTGSAGGDLTGTYPNPTIGSGKVTSTNIVDGTIVNADINSAAAVAYSKLALTGAVLNADLAGSIAYSKLALTGAILNADLAGSIAYSKLSLTGAVLNADLAGSIAASKVIGTAVTAADVGTVTSTMTARTNALSRTGALAETFPRNYPPGTITTFAPTAGAIYMIAIELPINLVIGHITFLSGTAAANGPTHQWFGLYNSSRVQLATTTDDTSTAWGGLAEKTLAVTTIASGASSTFTTTYSGLHYLGICQTASTSVAQLTVGVSNGTLQGLVPILMGTSSTAQTTPPAFAFTGAAITATGNVPYAYVSA